MGGGKGGEEERGEERRGEGCVSVEGGVFFGVVWCVCGWWYGRRSVCVRGGLSVGVCGREE